MGGGHSQNTRPNPEAPYFRNAWGFTLHVTGFNVLFAHFDECFQAGQAAT
jgi:hypothetical protein